MAAKIKNLQQWCKCRCEGYRDVEVTNMTSSWKSGLAFCAIIHRFRPDLIDYDSLSKENVYENNKLAFDVAQDQLNIAALLDPNDMVAMRVPDKLCIVTYVSQYHNYFRDKEPAGGPGVKKYRATPNKRPSSTSISSSLPESKKITPTKNSSTSSSSTTALSHRNQEPNHHTPNSHQTRHGKTSSTAEDSATGEPPSKRGTYGDTCHFCKKKVYLMERHIEGSRLYHRRCFRDQQRSTRSPTPSNAVPKFNFKPEDTTKPALNSGSAFKVNQPVSSKPSSSSSSSSSVNPKAANSSSNQTSLVKMLYGSPAPYGGSTGPSSSSSPSTTNMNNNNYKTASQMNTAGSPMGKSSSTFASSKLGEEKKPNISSLASKFDNSTKPRFGVTPQPAPRTNIGKPREVSCADATSSRMESMAGSAKTDKKIPLSSSGLKKKDDSSSTSRTESRRFSVGATSPVDNKGFSSNASALFSHQMNTDPRKPEPMEVSSPFPTQHSPAIAQKHPVSNGSSEATVYTYHPSAKSYNQTGQKKDSEMKSSLLSSLANVRKKTTPSENSNSSILKSRHQSTSPEDEAVSHKSILKPASPRQSFDASASSDHKPILKSRQSDEPFGSSPTRSILKQDTDHTSSATITLGGSKSILKSKEPIEFEIDIAGMDKPRSILKHLPETSPGSDETMMTTSRSILKHDTTNERESRSILKPKGKDSSPSRDRFQSPRRDQPAVPPSSVSRPKSTEVIPAPRAQVKVSPTIPAKSTAKYSPVVASKKDRSQSPRSILKRNERPVPKPANSTSPLVPKKAWEKPVAEKSGGMPTISSSAAKKNGAAVGNNFSAFNLQDSLLLAENKTTDNKSSGVSIDKGTSSKPSWQIEMEARTGVKQKETKHRAAPPRPSTAPPSKVEKKTETSKASSDDSGKPSWQLEAERRKAARNGKYQDPEFKYKYQKNDATAIKTNDRKSADLTASTTKPKLTTQTSRHSIGSPLDSSKVKEKTRFQPPTKGSSDSSLVQPPRPPPPQHKPTDLRSPPHTYEIIRGGDGPAPKKDSPPSSGKLNRTPAFRIPDNSPQSSPETTRSEVHIELTDNKKKILPEVNFTFQSGDFEMDLNQVDPETPPLPPTSPPPLLPGQNQSWIQQRPLPAVPATHEEQKQDVTPKRPVQAEARLSAAVIVRELEELDAQLRALEDEGRSMEDKIRAVSEDQMDEDVLMTQWFETVSKKNELVRRESELLYKQRQQELEDVHADLEYELRLLMAKPVHEKTASESVRENSLIAELLDTVNLRNNIIDSMEEDRIRYIAEDQEIADMMAKTVVGGSGSDKKKKKKDKKNKGAKDDQKADHRRDRRFFRKTIG